MMKGKQMNKKKLYIVISLVLVTILVILIIMLYIKINEQTEGVPTLVDTAATNLYTSTPYFATCTPEDTKDETTPTITPTATLQLRALPSDSAMATITISTDRKTRTYDIMDNVDEMTLKKNIGHLPSSAMPGEIGSCILMGHRDTDFSILQYVEVGDTLIVETNGIFYKYTVTYIHIVNSDSELRFGVVSEATLVLVTCYPFSYTGHAPKKYIITAKR